MTRVQRLAASFPPNAPQAYAYRRLAEQLEHELNSLWGALLNPKTGVFAKYLNTPETRVLRRCHENRRILSAMPAEPADTAIPVL